MRLVALCVDWFCCDSVAIPMRQDVHVVFALLIVFLALGVVGNLDYEEALNRWTEEKNTRADRAKIWSKKCALKGKRILATQADGGKWVVQCVNAGVKS